jgi:hypothetical protein
MSEDLKRGILIGTLFIIGAALLSFLSVNITRPVQNLWWNAGFEAGRASAVRDCNDHAHINRCSMPYGN